MNNKLKKLAVAVLAVCGMSGCASTQVAKLAGASEGANAAPATSAETQVMRPLQSYGAMGGYRYRRFASAAATS